MNKNYILFGVSAAAFLAPFTQTVYTPSLPELRGVFQVDTVLINLTISLFTAILAVGNFVVAPIADTRGRRLTALVGLAIYVAGRPVPVVRVRANPFRPPRGFAVVDRLQPVLRLLRLPGLPARAAGPLVGGWVELAANSNAVFLVVGALLLGAAGLVQVNLKEAK